jgi:hypothetical protein
MGDVAVMEVVEVMAAMAEAGVAVKTQRTAEQAALLEVAAVEEMVVAGRMVATSCFFT